MAATNDWEQAKKIANVQQLKIQNNVLLQVEAHHVVPQESACRGVILGVDIFITDEEISRFTRAPPGYEILNARRMGKSKAVVITFKGNEVPRSIEFDWNQIPCFMYKKTKAACLNCGEVGHRAGSCPKPRGYACTMCGTPNTGASDECTAKCALCGGPHRTYDKTCKEKFYTPTINHVSSTATAQRRGRRTEKKPQPSAARGQSRSQSINRSTSRTRTTAWSKLLNRPRSSSTSRQRALNTDHEVEEAEVATIKPRQKKNKKKKAKKVKRISYNDDDLPSLLGDGKQSIREEVRQLKEEFLEFKKETEKKSMLESNAYKKALMDLKKELAQKFEQVDCKNYDIQKHLTAIEERLESWDAVIKNFFQSQTLKRKKAGSEENESSDSTH
ncbi:hypothetical protein HPB47_017991 [Ixodes persulcatus]|uniref:Uncharacterized protein n=1 Tax=Ixodes persulcatus TaxID=34615 RepID=A0AC60QLW6_IXOPE|nr:hypothetical protein HPB47_017991 [Ixodes persulcatus]